MNLFLYRPAFDAWASELRGAVQDLGFRILEPDGSTSLAYTADDTFQAAWGSVELLAAPDAPVRDFMVTVLGSDTCRWFQSASAGVEHPVFRALFDKGLVLTNSPATAPAIAEYVLARVLAVFQPLDAYARAQAERRWARLPFREIAGSRWLVIGFGNIGRAVGARVRALGAHVTGVRRTPVPAAHRPPEAHGMITPEALPRALPEADVVVIALAAGPDTEGLVDDAFLARLAPGAVLVNVSRGSVVDEAALVRSLSAGHPGHAVLDVFATEPLPGDSPLWDLPNVTITGHASAHTEGTRRRGAAVFRRNLERFARGEPLEHRVAESLLAPREQQPW